MILRFNHSQKHPVTRATALLLALMILFVPLSRAQAQATPAPTFSNVPITLTITGNVSSGTAGMRVPSGLQLTLHIAQPPPGAEPSQSVKQDTALAGDGAVKYAD